jgi:predicted  nucleic acid-binding Zn-ribbon protein
VADEQVASLYATLEVVAETDSVEEMEKALASLDDQLGGVVKGIAENKQALADYEEWTKVTAAALDALGISAEEWATQLQRNEAEMQAARAEQEKLGESMARDVVAEVERAGSAFDNFSGVLSALTHGSIKDLLGALFELPAGFAAAFGAITTVIGGVEKLVNEYEQLSNKALSTGLSIESVQAFRRLGEEAGVGATTVENSIMRMQRALEGNGKAFKQLGLDAQALRGADTETQFNTITAAVAKLGTESERTAALTKMFGRGMATQLMPVIQELVTNGMPQMIALSEQQGVKLEELDRAGDKASGAFTDLKNQMLAAAAEFPGVADGLKAIGDAMATVALFTRDILIPAIIDLKAKWTDIFAAMDAGTNEHSAHVVQNLQAIKTAVESGAMTQEEAYRRVQLGQVQTIQGFGTMANGLEAELAAVKGNTAGFDALLEKYKEGVKVGTERVSGMQAESEAERKRAEDMRNHIQKLKETGEAGKQTASELDALQKRLGALNTEVKAQKTFDQLAKDITRLGGLTKVTNIESLAKQLWGLREAGATLTPELDQLAVGYHEAAKAGGELERMVQEQNKALEAQVQILQTRTGPSLNSLIDVANPNNNKGGSGSTQGTGTKEKRDALAGVGGLGTGKEQLEGMNLEKVNDDLIKAEASTRRWGQAFQAVSSLAGLFGVTASAAAGLASASFDQFAEAGRMSAQALRDRTNPALSATQKAASAAAASNAQFDARLNAVAGAANLAGSIIGGPTKSAFMQQAGAALQGAAAGAKMGQSLGQMIPVVGKLGGAIIGGLIGGIAGFINKGKQMAAEIKKIKDELYKAHGGVEAFTQEMKEAGIAMSKGFNSKSPAEVKKAIEEASKKLEAFKGLTDKFGGSLDSLKAAAARAGVDLKRMFDAKTPEDYLKAIKDINDELDTFQQALDKGNEIMERYGLTQEEMGARWNKLALDKQAATLIEDWTFLVGIGADMNAVLAKMGPSVTKFLDASVKAGSEIPSSMKPIIDALFKEGKLLHENGEKYTQAEYDALKYGKSQSEMFDNLIKKITDLVNALLGIPKNVNTNVNHTNTYDGNDGGGRRGRRDPDDEDDVPMADGGIVTRPTRILAGEAGAEAVIPLKNGGIPVSGGAGGGAIPEQHFTLVLDGQAIAKFVTKASKQGVVRIHPVAVSAF